MRRTATLLTILGLAVTAAFAQRRPLAPRMELDQPAAETDPEAAIRATLSEITKTGEVHLNVPEADGQVLRVLAEAMNAKKVVEIGTSTGVSSLWFCLALDKTGGKLQTFELDPGRAASARAHFKKAGVERLVDLIEGDAHQNLSKVKGTIDIAFIDAEKEGYLDYLKRLLPLVRPGGLILAHNMGRVPDYAAEVRKHPGLETIFCGERGDMAVSLKKK